MKVERTCGKCGHQFSVEGEGKWLLSRLELQVSVHDESCKGTIPAEAIAALAALPGPAKLIAEAIDSDVLGAVLSGVVDDIEYKTVSTAEEAKQTGLRIGTKYEVRHPKAFTPHPVDGEKLTLKRKPNKEKAA